MRGRWRLLRLTGAPRGVVGVAALLAVWTPGGGGAEGRPVGDLGAPRESTEPSEDGKALTEQLVSLGAARGDLEQLVRGARAAGFTESELRRVLGLVVRARLAGLPHASLLDKLREGLAKGVGPEGIERAIERRAQVLRQAKGLTDTLVVEGWTCPDYGLSVLLVGDALEAGYDAADVLRAIREGRPPVEGAPDMRGAFRKAEGRR